MKIRSNIRFAKLDDINQIIDLCAEHAIYEKAYYSKSNKIKKLTKDLFSKTPKLYCLIVENDNQLIGYATYMKQYATWDADEYIYMDCLYLKHEARGNRMGEMLVRRIQRESKKLGYSLIQWQTPNFNKRAIKFYNKIGARSKKKERFFLES